MTDSPDPAKPDSTDAASSGEPLLPGDPAELLGVGLPSEDGTPTLDATANAATASGPGSAGAAASPPGGFVPPTVEALRGLFTQLHIIELLGHGGMGAVYKAKQTSLDRVVAVKILPPQVGSSPGFAERFTREAKALARLNHANIVHVHDFGKVASPQGDLFYITMEYIDGANLRQAMRAGTMTPSQALAIVAQVCEALQFAHDEGVVHRDIKPENILIDTKGRVKIADFGLAKLAQLEGQEHDDIALTQTHAYMGTPRYMAPEQIEGAKEVDHRADIYSLGVVFYELLTGELPLGRFDPPSKKVQIDVRLDEVVLRTLEKEPGRRYQQASEVNTDLTSIAAVPGAATAEASRAARDETTPPTATVPFRSKSRGPAELLVAAAIMTLLTGIGIVAWWLLTGEYDAARPYKGPPKGALQWHMMAIAATHGGYALLIGGAAWLMLSLRARLVSLLIIILVGLLLPAMFIVNVLHTTVIEWPALIPFWLAMPVALWAVIALLRQDVRQDYEQAAGSRSSDDPRLSRLALVAAILVPMIAVGWPAWQVALRKYFDNMAGWEALPWYWKVFGAIGVLLSVAALFTPLLGAISLSNIKRSKGKLYGLRLAFADMMCYPLLLIAGGITFGIAFALQALLEPAPPARDELPKAGVALYIVAIPGAIVATVICFFIARAAWRAVSPAAPAEPRHDSKPADDASAFVFAIIAVVVFTLGLIVSAILLAVNQGPAIITFGGTMLLAVVFGLLGRRNRMGRYSASLALLLALGFTSIIWLRVSASQAPQGGSSQMKALDNAVTLPPGSKSDTIVLQGEEHLKFTKTSFKPGEPDEPVEKVVYYKTPFESTPYLTYSTGDDDGYKVVKETAVSFTLQRVAPQRVRTRVEPNGEILPQSTSSAAANQRLTFNWKAEGRAAGPGSQHPPTVDPPIPTSPTATVTLAAVDYDPIAIGVWTPLFDTPAKLAGTGARLDGGVVTVDDEFILDRAPAPVSCRDAIIRAKVDGYGSLYLRCTGDSYNIALNENGLGINKWKDGQNRTLAFMPTSVLPKKEGFREFALAVVGTRLVAYLDGKRLLDAIDKDIAASGQAAIHAHMSTARFKDIELMSLDGHNVTIPLAGRDVLGLREGVWVTPDDPTNAGVDGPIQKSTVVSKWVLDGKFMRSDVYPEGKLAYTVLETYDAKTGDYPAWVFAANGEVIMSRRTWVPKYNTLHAETVNPDTGATVTVETRFFPADGKQNGFLQVRDKDGKLQHTGFVYQRVKDGIEPRRETQDVTVPQPGRGILQMEIGEWEESLVMHPTREQPFEYRGRGRAIKRWDISGRYHETLGANEGGDYENLELKTYDAGKDEYRGWYFDSNGGFHHHVGRWDEKTRTINWEGIDSDGNTGTSVAWYIDKDRLPWNANMRNKDGELVLDMESVCARAGTPEAKRLVLDRRVGDWEQLDQGKPLQRLRARWVLDRRFVLGQVVHANNREEMWIDGYDEHAGTYRRWAFSSGGTRERDTVSWDSKTNTFRHERLNPSGWIVKVEEKFLDANHFEWSSLYTKPGEPATGRVGPLAFERCVDADDAFPQMPPAEGQDPRPALVRPIGPAELKILDSFVGRWSVQARDKLAGDTEWQDVPGSATMSWVLGGRYLLDEVRNAEGELTLLGLWTWDADGRAFRTWYFTPTGDALESTARWDKETQSFIGSGKLSSGHTMTLTHRFDPQGGFEFRMVTTDPRGRVVADVEGRKTQVK
ncbi:MAG: protein kinase [Phycisphaeraceae bacterium]